MAQRGRLWPVQQMARIFSGQFTWPNYPARQYHWRTDGWVGVALHPTLTEAVCDFVGLISPTMCAWRSPDLGPAGMQVTIAEMRLEIPDPPSEILKFSMQLYVDGAPQFDDSDWLPLDPFEIFRLSSVAGHLADDWILSPSASFGFDAVLWSDLP